MLHCCYIPCKFDATEIELTAAKNYSANVDQWSFGWTKLKYFEYLTVSLNFDTFNSHSPFINPNLIRRFSIDILNIHWRQITASVINWSASTDAWSLAASYTHSSDSTTNDGGGGSVARLNVTRLNVARLNVGRCRGDPIRPSNKSWLPVPGGWGNCFGNIATSEASSDYSSTDHSSSITGTDKTSLAGTGILIARDAVHWSFVRKLLYLPSRLIGL